MMDAYSAHYITDNVVIMFRFCSFHRMLYIVFMFKLSFMRLLFWCCTILMPPWGRYCVLFFVLFSINLSTCQICQTTTHAHLCTGNILFECHQSFLVTSSEQTSRKKHTDTWTHTYTPCGTIVPTLAQMVRAFGMNPKVEGSSSSQNFDTFTRTSVRVSKMNVAAHAQLIFEMITLLKISPVIISGTSDASTVKYHLNRSFNLFRHPFYNCAGNDFQITISIRSCIVLW